MGPPPSRLAPRTAGTRSGRKVRTARTPKVWFYCNSAAALGMYLYDKVYNKRDAPGSGQLSRYHAKELVRVGRWQARMGDQLLRPTGQLEANGPRRRVACSPHVPDSPPQNREFASFLYEAA